MKRNISNIPAWRCLSSIRKLNPADKWDSKRQRASFRIQSQQCVVPLGEKGGNVLAEPYKASFALVYANVFIGFFLIVQFNKFNICAFFQAITMRSASTCCESVATSPQIVRYSSQVPAQQRTILQRHRPVTLWLTGLSGAGKTTMAYDLEQALIKQGHACFVLDGDNLRHGLSRDLGFSPADRAENIRRVAEVAKLMNEAGLLVITAFISPYRADREMARQIVGEERFLEVYLCTSLAVCESRDPKQLYQRARRGEIAEFTGVSAPYEAPLAPAASINTAELSREAAQAELLTLLAPYLAPVAGTACPA